MINNDIRKLRNFLESIQPGPVPEDLQRKLVALVTSCWYEFDGSEDGGMAKSKVGRMEEPIWRPPHLFFTIERHGAMAFGSTRAELQRWDLNLDECTATYDSHGYRQLIERVSPWRAGPVAEELAQLIINGQEDPRLKWLSKNRVKVLTPSVLPSYEFSAQQTIYGRRRRLWESMEKVLSPEGWKRDRNIWEKASN